MPTGSFTLALADAFVRGMLVALLLVLARTLARHRQAAPARAALALVLGLAVQALGSMPVVEWQAPAAWQAPLVGVAVGNAVLFYVLARSLLDDRFRAGPRHGAAWLAAATVGWLRVAGGPLLPGVLFEALCTAQRLLPTAVACTVVLLALRQWKDDLVEARRSLRGFIVGVGALYTIVQVTLRLLSADGRLAAGPAILDVVLMALLVGGVAWRLLRVAPEELLVPPLPAPAEAVHPDPDPAPAREPATAPGAIEPPPPGPPADAEDVRVLEVLLSAMRADAYLEDGLSLGTLARRLGVAEYRLRRVIHQELGFGHFSAFVNSFRLSHARAALSDPARRSQPILDIALDAGFGSIGPFNRAFRAAEGMTPTEFRRQALAGS